MRTYWKRISMCYKDLTGHNMDVGVLEDVCNVRCPLNKLLFLYVEAY
jgi:hypothetical protein